MHPLVGKVEILSEVRGLRAHAGQQFRICVRSSLPEKARGIERGRRGVRKASGVRSRTDMPAAEGQCAEGGGWKK